MNANASLLYFRNAVSRITIFLGLFALVSRQVVGLQSIVYASTPTDFAEAFTTDGVSEIILTTDIRLSSLPETSLPLRLVSTSLVLSSRGTPQLVDPPLNFTGSTTVDFGNVINAIEVGSNKTLEFENLLIKGIVEHEDPRLRENAPPEAIGMALWPSLVAYPASVLVFNNTRVENTFFDDCEPETINRAAAQNTALFDGDYYASESPPGTYLLGNHTFPVAVNSSGGSTIGSMTIISEGSGFTCIPHVFGPTSSNDGLSAGAWAGIVIAVVSALMFVTFAVLIFKKNHRQGKLSLHFLKADVGESQEKSSIELNTVLHMQQEQQEVGYDSALRIRFGSLEGLELGALIGRGAHGRIYKGSFRGSLVAVKVVEHTVNEIQQSADKTGVTSEALMLTALSHPNIVTVYRATTIRLQTPETQSPVTTSQSSAFDVEHGMSQGSWSPKTPSSSHTTPVDQATLESAIVPSKPGLYETWLVMEYCNEGSLEKALKKKRLNSKDGKPRAPLILELLMDVATGMLFLHQSANLIHADLKPANVLLTSNGGPRPIAKIADFGLSRMLGGSQNTVQRTQALGTVHYMSPELMSLGRLTKSADVYAFGILAWEAWCCELAFEGMTAAQVFFSVVQQGIRPDIPDSMPAELQALIERCWHVDEAKRPGFEEVLRAMTILRHSIV